MSADGSEQSGPPPNPAAARLFVISTQGERYWAALRPKFVGWVVFLSMILLGAGLFVWWGRLTNPVLDLGIGVYALFAGLFELLIWVRWKWRSPDRIHVGAEGFVVDFHNGRTYGFGWGGRGGGMNIHFFGPLGLGENSSRRNGSAILPEASIEVYNAGPAFGVSVAAAENVLEVARAAGLTVVEGRPASRRVSRTVRVMRPR